jgi:hypothetical protein
VRRPILTVVTVVLVGLTWPSAALAADTTAPVVSPPDTSFKLGADAEDSGEAPNQAFVTLLVKWTQSDAGGSGVCQVRLWVRSDPPSPWFDLTPFLGGVVTSFVDFNHTGHIYQFRVRALDCAGNASEFAVGQRFFLGYKREATATYNGSWITRNTGIIIGDSIRTAIASGASARYMITARRVAYLGLQGPNKGTADLFTDGAFFRSVDLFAQSETFTKVLARRAFQGSGPHTVRIVRDGPGQVDTDGLLYMNW